MVRHREGVIVNSGLRFPDLAFSNLNNLLFSALLAREVYSKSLLNNFFVNLI